MDKLPAFFVIASIVSGFISHGLFFIGTIQDVFLKKTRHFDKADAIVCSMFMVSVLGALSITFLMLRQ